MYWLHVWQRNPTRIAHSTDKSSESGHLAESSRSILGEGGRVWESKSKHWRHEGDCTALRCGYHWLRTCLNIYRATFHVSLSPASVGTSLKRYWSGKLPCACRIYPSLFSSCALRFSLTCHTRGWSQLPVPEEPVDEEECPKSGQWLFLVKLIKKHMNNFILCWKLHKDLVSSASVNHSLGR